MSIQTIIPGANLISRAFDASVLDTPRPRRLRRGRPGAVLPGLPGSGGPVRESRRRSAPGLAHPAATRGG